MTTERFEELMVKVTDGAASPAEREELMSWVAERPELKTELEEHLALRAVTDGWMARLEADLVEDRHEKGVAHRVVQGVGVGLIVAGLALLTIFGAVEALIDPDVPLGLKLGLSLSYGGFGFLLIYLIVVRMANHRKDPYTKVIR